MTGGTKHIAVSLDEIKVIKHDIESSYIKFYFLNETVEGYVDDNKFNAMDFSDHLENGKSCDIVIYQDYDDIPQVENEE